MTTETTTAAKKNVASKKATKKVEKKVAVKRDVPKIERADEKERTEAKNADLSIPHLRILRAIAKAGKPLSYRQIEAKTGYYSTLTALLRKDNEGSSGALGYTKEEMHDIDGRDVLTFAITAAGKKVLEKAKAK